MGSFYEPCTLGALFALALLVCFSWSMLARTIRYCFDYRFCPRPSGGTFRTPTLDMNEATGVERRAVTNESGYYIISSLPLAFTQSPSKLPALRNMIRLANKLDPNIATTVEELAGG